MMAVVLSGGHCGALTIAYQMALFVCGACLSFVVLMVVLIGVCSYFYGAHTHLEMTGNTG